MHIIFGNTRLTRWPSEGHVLTCAVFAQSSQCTFYASASTEYHSQPVHFSALVIKFYVCRFCHHIRSFSSWDFIYFVFLFCWHWISDVLPQAPSNLCNLKSSSSNLSLSLLTFGLFFPLWIHHWAVVILSLLYSFSVSFHSYHLSMKIMRTLLILSSQLVLLHILHFDIVIHKYYRT